MIRTLAAAAAVAMLALASLAPAGAASAQTYGQPVYLNSYGRPVGGSPLSEFEARSYVGTGAWADGYSERSQVYVPAPGHGYGRYGQGYGHDRRYSHGRHDPLSRAGYRDEWGYNDDRPASARRGSDDRHGRRYDRDCSCNDVYLYDR